MEQKEIIVKHIDTRSVMTKSNTPIGGYSVNPYVGCPHACKYCYASFMKRFTGHTEDWGTFMDVKNWPVIKNPKKYAGQKVVIGTVTDGYNPLEETYRNTRRLLEELKDSGADILICTKSDLVLQDIDLQGASMHARLAAYAVSAVNPECLIMLAHGFGNLTLRFGKVEELGNTCYIYTAGTGRAMAAVHTMSLPTYLGEACKYRGIIPLLAACLLICRRLL